MISDPLWLPSAEQPIAALIQIPHEGKTAYGAAVTHQQNRARKENEPQVNALRDGVTSF
jgi:hypothetical protein